MTTSAFVPPTSANEFIQRYPRFVRTWLNNHCVDMSEYELTDLEESAIAYLSTRIKPEPIRNEMDTPERKPEQFFQFVVALLFGWASARIKDRFKGVSLSAVEALSEADRVITRQSIAAEGAR